MCPHPEPPSGQPVLGMVANFAATLRDAIHDKTHELTGVNIVHLWDDDSLFLPIRGVMAWGHSEQAEPDTLAQALFSAGYLGQVRLLSPHRDELLVQISRWSREPVTKKELNAKIASFLGEPQAQALLSIAREVRTNADPNEDFARDVIDRLSELPARALEAIEASWGAWPTRLSSLVKRGLLDLDPFGPSVTELADAPMFPRLATDIHNLRGGERSLASAIDAAALAAVAQMAAAAREGSAPAYPRFFTSSRNLQKLFRTSGWVQDLLYFEYSEGGAVRRGSAWRDGRYYFMRALYPALRIGQSEAAPHEGPTLDDLSELSRELDRALTAGSDKTIDLLNEFPLTGDKSIVALVREFEAHRMAEVWMRYGDDKELPEKLGDLRSLHGFGALPLTRKISAGLEQEYLRDFLGELREREVSLQIIDAVLRTSHGFESASRGGTLSLNRDLGSLRWGLEYTSKDDVVSLHINDQLGASFGELLKFYDVSHIKGDVRSAERVLAVLVGLDQFDVAARVVQLLDSGVESETIHLLSMVATICARGYRSEESLLQAENLLRNRWAGLSDREKANLALGYGFAGFAIWSYSARGGAWPFGYRKRGKDLAEWSIAIVREYLTEALLHAKDWGAVSDLRIAYAVNHIVYVATSADLVDGEVEDMADGLERIADKLDNYRFLDTVGVFLMWKARRLSRGEPLDDLAHQLQVSLAERSLVYLERAAQLVRTDAEVVQHRDEASEFLHRYR